MNSKIAIILFFISSFAIGQTSFEVDVVNEVPVELEKADRVYDLVPPMEVDSTEIEPQDYNDKVINVGMPDLKLKMKVYTISGESIPLLTGNYVKAGFGNYVTPYFEGFFNSTRNHKYLYGVHLKHLSSKNGPTGDKPSGTSENGIDAYGKYLSKKHIFSGELSYNSDTYRYYGVGEGLGASTHEGAAFQAYNIFKADAAMENVNTQTEWKYGVGLGYSSLSTSSIGTENEIRNLVDLGYEFSSNKVFFLKNEAYFVTREDSLEANRNFVRTTLAYSLKKDRYTVLAGLRGVYDNDTMSDAKNYHVYPVLEGSYTLKNNITTFFGGVSGDMERTSLSKLYQKNPWLTSNVALINTNKNLSFYGGVKGKVFKKMSYNTSITLSNFKYINFFTNTNTLESQFDIVYGEENTTQFKYNFQLVYNNNEKIRLGADFSFFSYNSSDYDELYHLPKLDLKVFGTYNLHDKMYFNVDILYIGGLIANDITLAEEVELNPIVDLNLKIDYQFSPKISFYVEGNNLLSKQYQRYYKYSVKEINVLAGFTVAF